MARVAALCAAAAPAAAAAATKPHLVFALIDDWGWYDVGFRGNSLIKTPFIDALIAKDAALLERHYTYKFCSPTRRSFLSGRFPPHSGQDNSAKATVDLRMHTIADKLASAGYSTHQAGKWHAGHFVVGQTPHGRGFATSLGYFNGACDHYTQKDGEDGCKAAGMLGGGSSTDLWNTDEPGYGLNGTYGDYLYVGRAVETIQKHDPSTPLFFYLAMQCAHSPMEAPQRFQDLYNKSTVPNLVEYAFSSVIDEGLSNVTAALKAKDMWGTTLMVVSADNGGPAFSDQHAASNYPLRGGKYTYFEGGIRVNAFVTGGLLPAKMRGTNVSSAHIFHICDWYATFSGLAGVDAADDADGVPSIDSVDQWPAISGGAAAPARTEVFVGNGVLIQGNYKLVAAGAGNAQWSGPLYPKVKATGPSKIGCSSKDPCLFDVVADPWEYSPLNTTDSEHASVVQRMSARLDELMKGVFEGKSPANVTQAEVCAATQKNGMYLTPSDWVPPRRGVLA